MIIDEINNHIYDCSNFVKILITGHNVLFLCKKTECSNWEFKELCNSKNTVWLKLEKSNSIISLFSSNDGTSWVFHQTISINYSNNIYVGLLSCPQDSSNYYNWYYSNYIQLHCSKDLFNDYGWGVPLDFFTWIRRRECYNLYHPWLFTQNINKNMIMKITNPIEFVINAIESDYYIDLILDEYYIPERKAYREYNYNHQNLIFGYDLANKTIDLYGFHLNRNFKVSKVSFDDFYESFINTHPL